MGSTDDFLRLLNEDNARIAAREAKVKEEGVDQVQLKLDRERREKWGQLRARSHSGKRPNQAHNVFGYINLDH